MSAEALVDVNALVGSGEVMMRAMAESLCVQTADSVEPSF